MDISKILKSDYLDLLFDGRNKKYGGYELRNNYPKRARNATIGTLMVAALLAAGPVIAGIIKGKESPRVVISLHENVLSELPPIEKDKPKPPPVTAPPAPSRPTKQFVAPRIVENEEVNVDVTPPDETKNEIAGLKSEAGDPNASELKPPSNGTGDGHAIIETRKEEIRKWVSQMPQFKDGDVNAWLSRNTNYPSAARDNNVEGRVIMTFVINEDGVIEAIEVGRSSGNSSLDNEARRVIASMPAWTPGKNNGEAVKVQFSLPITFELN